MTTLYLLVIIALLIGLLDRRDPLKWFMYNLWKFPNHDADSSPYEDVYFTQYGPVRIQVRECIVMDVDNLEISLSKWGYRWTRGDDRDALGKQGWFRRTF